MRIIYQRTLLLLGDIHSKASQTTFYLSLRTGVVDNGVDTGDTLHPGVNVPA